MPDDLPPIREDGTDDWVYALPGRKDDKQLFRLAAANAEAEGGPGCLHWRQTRLLQRECFLFVRM